MTRWSVQIGHRVGTLELRLGLQSSGGVVALMGPNGAGKSTFVRALVGALRPDEGRIELGGDRVFDAERGVWTPPEARRVGLVPQGLGLFGRKSVLDNAAFGPRARGASRTAARARAARELERLGLSALAHRSAAHISSGEAQRLALARALASDPRLLVLDEPFSALDVGRRRVAREALSERLAGEGLATLLVTHDPRDAVALGAHVVVIEDGQIVQEGDCEALAAAPATPFVAELFGTWR